MKQLDDTFARAVTEYGSYPLGLSQSDFPLRSQILRRIVATNHERCPECGGFLDTGNECNDCGFDAMPEVRGLSNEGANG